MADDGAGAAAPRAAHSYFGIRTTAVHAVVVVAAGTAAGAAAAGRAGRGDEGLPVSVRVRRLGAQV